MIRGLMYGIYMVQLKLKTISYSHTCIYMKTWVVDIQWYLHMVAELAGNNKRYQEKNIYIGYSNSVYPF